MTHSPESWTVEIETEKASDGSEVGRQIYVTGLNRLLFDSDWADQSEWEESLAAAYLLVAAPETKRQRDRLLAALKAVREMKHLYQYHPAADRWNEAEAAIAEAEGGEANLVLPTPAGLRRIGNSGTFGPEDDDE